jgi:hypothetical protein
MWRIALAGCLACALWTGPSTRTSVAATGSRQASASNQASNPFVSSQIAVIAKMQYLIIHADYSHCACRGPGGGVKMLDLSGGGKYHRRDRDVYEVMGLTSPWER